jgi:glycosyltransferase involved in cell wall biosynthesis
MRILFVVSRMEAEWTGGIGRVAAGFAVELARLGHEVHLAGSRHRDEPGQLPGVVLHPWAPRRRREAQLAPLLRLLRRLRPEVVHLHSAVPSAVVTLPLVAWRRGSARPVLVASPYTGTRTHHPSLSARLALRAADGVVTSSRWAAERAVRAGARAATARAIPAGVPLPPVRAAGERDLRVVALARLVRAKGIDVLLEAFAEATRTRPGFRLSIAGAGPEAGRLRERAAALGLGERVELLGFVGGAEKQALLASAAIGVVPSREDHYPGALLELMAAGVACIASAVGGLPEIAAHGEAARLVPAGDPGALARALAELMDDAQARRALGEAARAASLARTFERITPPLEALYRELLAARGPG